MTQIIGEGCDGDMMPPSWWKLRKPKDAQVGDRRSLIGDQPLTRQQQDNQTATQLDPAGGSYT